MEELRLTQVFGKLQPFIAFSNFVSKARLEYLPKNCVPLDSAWGQTDLTWVLNPNTVVIVLTRLNGI